MRDHRKLEVYQLADELALRVYRGTAGFPKEELYGLVSQMRRSAVSVAANIVEGCGRRTEREFDRFLDIAFGSLRELGYLIDLSIRLGYWKNEEAEIVQENHGRTSAALASFINSRSSYGLGRQDVSEFLD